MNLRLTISAGLAVSLIATSVLSADRVTVPEGCVPLVTAHKEDCAVSVIFDCGGDRLVMDFEDGQLSQQALYDPQWSLREYEHFNEGEPVLTITASDGVNMAMDDLLAEGAVEMEGAVLMSTGIIKSRAYRYAGTAVLTGDSENFGETEYLAARLTRDLTLSDDVPGMSFEIDVLIDPVRNLMIEGAWQRSAFGGETEYFPQKVRAVHEEGDPGFLSERSEYGCD